jgi:uncharacterized protein (TIRG00374 family)
MKVGSKHAYVVLLSLVSSVVFLGFAVSRLKYADVARAYAHAHLIPWVPLAIASYLGGHLVRGVRCRMLVSREVTLSLAAATNVVVLGYAANNILPARIGEFARAGMLSRMCGLPYLECLTITFVERIFDGLALLVMLTVASTTFPEVAWLATTVRVGAVIFGSAALLVVAALLAPSYILTITSRVTQRIGQRVHDRMLGLVSQIVAGVSYIRDLKTALSVAGLSVIIWTFEGGMFLALLPAFEISPNPWLALLTMTATNFGILAPSSPGFIGPFHYFCMQALALAGVPESIGFSYAVLAHLSFYVPITLWGVGILGAYGVSLGKIAAEAREARPIVRKNDEVLSNRLGQRSVSAAPRPFFLALIEALLPVEMDHLPAAERKEVLHAVTTFVAAQMNDLPGRVSYMFSVGMTGFAFVTLLLRFSRLAHLPIAARRRWVEAWAYGHFALARQLFRGVRSTAFIAYYEHPLICAQLDLKRETSLIRTQASAI